MSGIIIYQTATRKTLNSKTVGSSKPLRTPWTLSTLRHIVNCADVVQRFDELQLSSSWQ